MIERKIKVKAVCLLIQGNMVLVADGASMKSDIRKIVPSSFYRVIGGSVNFNEKAQDAVRREVREEVGTEIQNLEFLTITENIFIYAGEPEHEVIFLYKGKLSSVFDTNKTIHVFDDGYEFDMIWVSIPEILEGGKPLYPILDYSKFLS